MIRRAFDAASTISVGGTSFRGGTDFIATARGGIPSLDNVDVVFGGTAGDSTTFRTASRFAARSSC